MRQTQRSPARVPEPRHESPRVGAPLPALDHSPRAAAQRLRIQAAFGPWAAPVLQALFLDPQAAREAFGAAYQDAHLDERLLALNQIVSTLPDGPRQWLESLSRATRLSLLQQAGAQGNGLMQRICQNLVARPPVYWPDPRDDSVAWRFLLEVAKPALPKTDLGMLGRLPDWVATLREIYTKAEVHILERDLQAFHASAEAGRRHLADVRSFVADLGDDTVQEQPQQIMVYLTRELTGWLATLYRGSASALGLQDYALLAVGSVGRDEMFPRSDLDYTVLVNVLTDKVGAVDEMIALSLKLMGEPALDEIGKGPPQDVALEHVVTKRDVLLDARTLHQEGTGGQLLAENYYQTRAHALSDEARRHQTATMLIDTESKKFSAKSAYLSEDDKDVKKGLLRQPTFTVRNLAFYYGREGGGLSVWDRVADLQQAGVLSRPLAERILKVVNFASSLRIRLHNFYQAENEVFRVPGDATPDYKGYVLTESEEAEFHECVEINRELEKRSEKFTIARSQTLAGLRVGAQEQVPTEADADPQGPDRGTRIRSTVMVLVDGRTAVLQEQISAGDVISRRVQLDGGEYWVQPDDVLKPKSSGTKQLYSPSTANPFST